MRWQPPGCYPPHYGRTYDVMDPYHSAVYGRMMPPQPYPFDRATMHPMLDKCQVNCGLLLLPGLLHCLYCNGKKVKINVGCCWHESVSCLLFYCQTLPISYLTDQRIILFWKKALICDNNVVRTLASISRCSIGLTLSKYHLSTSVHNAHVIKDRMWSHFVDVACDRGQIVFC